MAKEYKIGDTYWYVDYGTGGELKVYCIKICSAQDFGKGIAQFDTEPEAEQYLAKTEAGEIFINQYNDSHKELVVKLKVTINSVLPNNKREKRTPEQLQEWFEKHIAALETGLQVNYGNGMHRIKVEKVD